MACDVSPVAMFGKRRALFSAKIQVLDGRKDGQNSSFAHPLMRSATPLRVQSVSELLSKVNHIATRLCHLETIRLHVK